MRRKTKIEGTLPLHESLLGNITFELVVHVKEIYKKVNYSL